MDNHRDPGTLSPFLKTIHTYTQVYTLLGYGSSKPLLLSRECGGRDVETSAVLTMYELALDPGGGAHSQLGPPR